MRSTLEGLRLILGLALIPYAIAVIMPTWRWLLGATLVIGGLLSATWIQDWIVTSGPDYREGVGGALGRAFFMMITLGFVTGVAVRAFTLVLAWRQLRLRYVLAICCAGFAIVPAIIFLPGAWRDWTMRQPSDACLSAKLDVKIANANLAVPPMRIFNVYLGNTSRKDVYYFNHNPDLRAFCALNDNGRQQVKASMIWLHLGQYLESPPSICVGVVADWAGSYCAAYGTAHGIRNDSSIEFPLDIQIFAPDEFVLGEFGGSRSTYEDSLHPRSGPEALTYIGSNTLTPNQQPLTFKCRESGSDYWCQASYSWRDGANLEYSFRSGRDEVAAKGARIDVETRKFLVGLTAKR